MNPETRKRFRRRRRVQKRDIRRRTREMRLLAGGVMTLAALAAWSQSAEAQVVGYGAQNLFTDDWRIAIDPTSDFGLADWSGRGGVAMMSTDASSPPPNQIFRAHYWFRVGDETFETALSSFNYLGPTHVPGAVNQVTLNYYNAIHDFSVNLTYRLEGDSPLASTIWEELVITNESTSALDMIVFQYTDYDLDGDAAGDVGQHTGNPSFPSFRQLTQMGTFVDHPEPHRSAGPVRV